MKSFSVKCAHEVDKMDGYCSYERWNEAPGRCLIWQFSLTILFNYNINKKAHEGKHFSRLTEK